MLCCRKALFVTLCSVGREMGEDARATHKAGLLPVHLLNSLWDLQTFKTSLKLHLSPAVNTNMGCHFKRDSRNPVSWYHSGLSLTAKRASGWSLLAKSSLLFCGFFSFCPFFLVKWRTLSRAEVCTNPRAGQRLECQIPAPCDLSKGGGICSKQGWQGL